MNTGIVRTGDGSHTLFSERYGETYHSINGATTESRHVFLEASGVALRLEKQQPTRILEIGFGLGLNFLLTADMALQHGTALDYHALEYDPSVLLAIPFLQYEQHLRSHGLLERLVTGLSDALHQRTSRMTMGPDVTLTLHQTNAIRDELPPGRFNALYLDAFSPDTNPECWTEEFLVKLHTLGTPGGVLTTYSAKGSVRRALIASGFTVKKLPGPPGKREMLHATI